VGLGPPVDPGQTPIDEDEKDGLLIPTITTRKELNEFEQLNIEEAVQWTLGTRFDAAGVLTEEFIKDLHGRMFGSTWAWAGRFRTTNKNIGVDKFEIAVHLRALLDDTRFWVDGATYEPDELCIRFKYRLVSIHCFTDGNGRHARLMADILVEHEFGRPVFTWGGATLAHPGQARSIYISALRSADTGIIAPLVTFARL